MIRFPLKKRGESSFIKLAEKIQPDFHVTIGSRDSKVKNSGGHQTHILQSKEQDNDPAAKLQNLADHSNIVSQLSAFQEVE